MFTGFLLRRQREEGEERRRGGREMEREGNEREMRRVRGVGEREREDHHSAAAPSLKSAQKSHEK